MMNHLPRTIVLYRGDDGGVPVLQWLRELNRENKKAARKVAAAISRLKELGPRLRRPLADYLQDGVYELRIRLGRVNYRVLYFFHGGEMTVLVHAFTKEARIPKVELKRALDRKRFFEANPKRHTHLAEGFLHGQDS